MDDVLDHRIREQRMPKLMELSHKLKDDMDARLGHTVIMQELSERTDGLWKLSPGSVYPTLQQLEDEGLVKAEQTDGKNVFHLTAEGQSKVEASTEAPPWERFGAESDDGLIDLRETGFQVGAAVMQVARAGSDAQIERAKTILEKTRREIYQILAEDERPIED